MKNLLIYAACLMTLASCNNSGSTETTEATPVDSTSAAPATEPVAAQGMCYIIAEGKDTTSLNLTIAADGTVTGSYDWVPWEKDSARGTITGKKEGDLLKVTYDYMIEGSNQQEEKVFKLTGDQVQEGEGELTEGEGGILKLKDASKLTWRPMTKVACK